MTRVPRLLKLSFSHPRRETGQPLGISLLNRNRSVKSPFGATGHRSVFYTRFHDRLRKVACHVVTEPRYPGTGVPIY